MVRLHARLVQVIPTPHIEPFLAYPQGLVGCLNVWKPSSYVTFVTNETWIWVATAIKTMIIYR